MIDFRYHLVSIVSIFLALAAGIVLGAGPLQQELGKTLSNQVATLRQEKADLRAQLDQAQQHSDTADEFATAVAPRLVASQLGGRHAVLVTLPGTDSKTVKALAKTITASGATVSGTVAVQPLWTDPAKRSFRDQLVTSLEPLVGATDAGSASLEARMGSLLAKALVVSQVSEANRPSSSSTQALSGLKDAGLISFDGDGPAPATLAVVVGNAPEPNVPDDVRAARLSGWAAIAGQLDAASSGAVVVGPTASASDGGLVHAVRSDDALSKEVSTVDYAATPGGRVAVVYALREQMNGKAGQYGTGSGASAVLPTLAAAS